MDNLGFKERIPFYYQGKREILEGGQPDFLRWTSWWRKSGQVESFLKKSAWYKEYLYKERNKNTKNEVIHKRYTHFG